VTVPPAVEPPAATVPPTVPVVDWTAPPSPLGAEPALPQPAVHDGVGWDAIGLPPGVVVVGPEGVVGEVAIGLAGAR
jgi:hypothetical protein